MATANANNRVLINLHENLENFLSVNPPGSYKDFLDDIAQYYFYNKDLLPQRKSALVIAYLIVLTILEEEAEEASHIDVSDIVFYLFSNYKNHREKFNSYMKERPEKNGKKNITDDQLLQIQHAEESLFVYYFTACSFAQALLDNSPAEAQTQVSNGANIYKKYKLMCELVATKNNIKGALIYIGLESQRSWVNQKILMFLKSLAVIHTLMFLAICITNRKLAIALKKISAKLPNTGA